MERLPEMQEKYEIIGKISGLGLHIGIDLIRDPVSKERAVTAADSVMYKCMEKGVALKTIEGNILTLRPALTISEAEMRQAIDVIDDAIGEVSAGKMY